MTEGTQYPTIEQMHIDLKEAGWVKAAGFVWLAPTGDYYTGPYGAWREMNKRATKRRKIDQ